jgi:hypothetical protein
MEVIDLNGKTIAVTDIKEAIAQAEMFSGYSNKNSPKEVNQLAQAYWIDLRDKLKKLELIENVKIHDQLEDNNPVYGDIPIWVIEMRQMYPNTLDDSNQNLNSEEVNISRKGFSKDRKDSPLYGAHSCVRTLENLNRLDKLKVGETWERFGSPSITRIF